MLRGGGQHMEANLGSGSFLGTAWAGKTYASTWRALEGGTQPVIEPATGEEIARTAVANPADLDRAVRDAMKAQPAWAATRAEQRRDVLLKVARLLEQHADEIGGWLVREGGSVPAKAKAEIQLTGGEVLEAASLPTQANGIVFPSVPGQWSMAQRVPLGVVGVITPWNFPLILAMRAVAPALALGNAVVLKPDAQTSVAGGIAVARLFEEAGLPASVLQVVPGGGETGESLVKHHNVSMISFTGSTAVGRRVGELAGGMLKRVSLELGGNNAFIVLDDADLDAASSNGAWGSYLHQGQICMAAGRHLVHEKVAEAYLARLAERAQRLPVGDPHRAQVALGPLINKKQLERVDRIVQQSAKAGAEIRAGGTHEGLFYHPTVLARVAPGMPAFEEEIFGPVAPVTIFRDDDEAVALANASPYGLSAAVQSRSAARGLDVARRLRSGMVHVNDQTVNVDAIAPFGGMGCSGNGTRYGRTAALDEFTQWQWITVKDHATAYPF
jgi:benzaldehyde dehydrogenase (NAD)